MEGGTRGPMRECQAVLSRDASQLGKRIQLTFLEVQAMEGNSARFSGRKVASGKLGKGGRDVGSNSETFRWNPVGNQSHPGELGQQPEASLAWGPAMVTAKRRQRVPRPCYRASKDNMFVGALVVLAAGAASACLNWPGTSVLPGSKNRASAHEDPPGT